MTSPQLATFRANLAANTLTDAERGALLVALDTFIDVFPQPDEISGASEDMPVIAIDWVSALFTIQGAGGSPVPPTTALTDVTGTAPIVVTDPTLDTRNVAITPATDAAAGSMSAADKTKLDGIGAIVTAVTASAPLASTGGATPNLTITPATDAAAGSMSAADKTKLDGIGAVVSAVTASAPLTSTGGATPNLAITAATDVAAGSMSAADKTKLDSLALPAAPVTTATVQALAAIPAGRTVAGFVAIAIPFTPQARGNVMIGATIAFGQGSVAENLNLQLFLYQGAAASGGTVVNGVRYYQGGAPVITVTGGSFVSSGAFVGMNSVLNVGSATFEACLSVDTVAAGLTPGLPYLAYFQVSGNVAGSTYPAGSLANAFAAELS